MAAHAPTSLDFALRFVDGRGYLGLRERAAFGPGAVERLELEVPNLRFPFDVSGGAARFQTRRCLLTAAELRTDGTRLAGWLAARPQLQRYGFSALRARIADGRIELDGRARVGESEAPVTARIFLQPSGQRLRAWLSDVRVYGFLPAPAPLVGLGLLYAAGAQADGALRLDGIDLVELNPLELILWRALPPHGWRLPRYQETALAFARCAGGEVALGYGGEAQPITDEVRALDGVHERLVAADRLLLAGDAAGALAGYAEAARDPDFASRPEPGERELALLAQTSARSDEAQAAAAKLIERFPSRPFALLTLAALDAERGDAAGAAARYQHAAELATAGDEPADAAWAALAAGEWYARAGLPDATRWLERALAERPDDARTCAQLAERYAAESRWRELLQLEKRRLGLAHGAREEAQARVRLGRVWLERLGEPARARDELEQAARLDEQSGEAWRWLGRALDAGGDSARGLAALERVLELSPAPAELYLEAADFAERAGALPTALAHVERALAEAPEHAFALGRLATLNEKLGQVDAALDAYERAAEAATDPAARASLYAELARLAHDGLKDPAQARAWVERSLALTPTPEALRLAVGLAERDGRAEDLEQLLRLLGEGGDRDAHLRRARVLFDLGRHLEAAVAAEVLAGARPDEALPIVIAAREALGHSDMVRGALERLVLVRKGAPPRIRLARLQSDDGELDGARALLADALAQAADADEARAALEALCDVLLRQGDDAALELALGRLAAIRTDEHGRARALAAQGAARARLGLTAEAAESYRAALALEPDDATARAGLAEAAWALHAWDEARAALEPLHQRGIPPRVERALRLGEIAERQQQPPAAIGFYQAALEAGASGGDAVRAYNALTSLYHARGDHDAESRAQLAAADDERTGEGEVARASRLVAAADLMRKRAGRGDEARATYERALTLDSLQMAALDALEALADAENDAALTAQVLGRKVAATARRPAQQKAILGRLAQLQAERLGRPDAAREAYARALDLDPDFRPALIFLAHEARLRGDAAEERERLSRLVALPADPADPDARPAELTRLAQLLSAAGRGDEAEALARRALDAQPRHAGALALLDEIYTQAGRTDELAGVLGERARAETGAEPALELLHRRAALLDDAGRRREAIDAWQELVTLRPSLNAAWNRLAALLRLEEAWEPLAQVLTRLAERHAADGRRGEAEALHVEVAHLSHDRLHDRERAHAALMRALEVEPRSRVALGGLLALARARGDSDEEDALLGRLADAETRPEARAQAVAERARSRQARGDLDGAAALLAELDVANAPDAALRLRVEIEEGRAQKDFAAQKELAASATAAPALEALSERARASGDVAGERWAVKRLARLAAERGPSPAAEELLRRAVELDPDDRDAVRALAAVERARGDDGAYLESLERLLRAARRGLEGAEREAEIGVEMARVEKRVGNLDGAQARLREALSAAPDHGPAWRLRGALHAETGARADAAHALERAAELGALDEAGFVELGELHLLMEDPTHAAAAFTRAGGAAPPRRLAEALERAGKEGEAIQVWRGLGGDEARTQVARLERRRAERAFHAGRAAEARVSAVEALIGDPRDEEALAWATHGLSPAAVLALLDELSRRLPEADAAALIRRVAARLDGDDARVALERAAELAPDAATLVLLGDRERGEAAARHYQMALALDPSSVDAAFGLFREGAPPVAAEALADARAACTDARTRARLSAVLGELLRDRLDDTAGARDAFRRAVDESAPGDPSRDRALRSLAALERASDPRAAEEALELLRAERSARDDDLRHLAELYAERGAYDPAIAILKDLGGSTELLMQYLQAAGRHADLVALYELEAPRKPPAEGRALFSRAAAIAAGPLADPHRAVALYERALPLGPSDGELWSRLGKLYEGPLDEPERAARAYARAWAADRARTEVLLPLGDFHHALGEHEPAGDYFRLALENGAVPDSEIARVHLRLGDHARARADAIAEEQELRAALQAGADPSHWERLAAIYRVRGDGKRLAEALQKLASRRQGTERAVLLREAAAHLPAEEAAELDEQIVADDPDDEAARDRVLERLRTGGDPAALIARLDEELERSAGSTARRARLALELGRLQEKAGNHAAALACFRSSLLDAPALDSARALDELLARTGRQAEAADVLEAALFDARLPPDERAELLALATRAHLQTGGDNGRSLAYLQRARAAGLKPEIAPDLYRELLRAELRFPELVAALDEAAAIERDPDRQLRLELDAIELLGRELAQPADAARRSTALFAAHPESRDLAERARSLWAAAGESRRALEILEQELRLAPADEQPQLRIVRGELLLAGGEDNEAEAEFLHAMITTRRVGRAHAALAAVYKKRGDLAGSLEHLIAAADAPDLEPARAAACAVDAAEVLLREGDATTAERLYQLAAALDAADRRAVEGLAHLAAARGEYERQAELLGRAALLTPDRRERARLALERARLYQRELGRDLDAYRCYKEAVACDPTLRDAARGLREMAEARGEWALAAEQLYREIAATPDDQPRALLHLELARLLEEKLYDSQEALRNYEQTTQILWKVSAGRGAPWGDLVRLYVDESRLREAAAAADRWTDALAGEEPGRRAEALARAGELYDRLGDHESARERMAKAAALGGEHGRKADDFLLRLADEAGDPDELRRRIEERLAIEPEGEMRLELLRRLLSLAAHAGDAAEVELRAQEILARAPDDPLAFVERKRGLEQRGDEAGVATLLRARASAVEDPAERAARRFEAGRIAERLGDVPAAFADYEAALAVDEAHVPALDALADLAWRSHQQNRARALYAQLGDRPSALPPDEVSRRRAELAEQAGDFEDAMRLYAAAAAQNPSSLTAHESLARLALSRGSGAAAFSSLKAVLELLPLDAVDRITELRRQLGKLALKLGEREQARHYFELVLAQDPTRADALQALAHLYLEAAAWEEAAHTYARLSYLVDSPAERADLLYRRGEILRLRLGDLDRANDAYLKAADLHPTHAPTLRRLIHYYYREGDLVAVTEVARELESLPAPLDDAAVEAGLGIALAGDEARGTVVVAVAQPTGARLATALGQARISDVAQLDPALRAAMRALGGWESGRALLGEALRERMTAEPVDLGVRLALGRLFELSGEPAHARMQYAVPAFVDWTGAAARRVRELPPPQALPVDPERAVHPSSRGPLREALIALGPVVLGLPCAPLEAEPAPAWAERLEPLARAFGFTGLEAAVVTDLLDPAWAEPTRPPRVLLQRRVLGDESVARFATVRALHALAAGVPLVEGRSLDDVAALVRAAAALFLPDLQATLVRAGAFVHAWQAELRALGVVPEALPEALRSHLEVALAACAIDSQVLASAPAYCAAERLTADRVALIATGDLRAGLLALCPSDATTPAARLAALTESTALAELLAFAASMA